MPLYVEYMFMFKNANAFICRIYIHVFLIKHIIKPRNHHVNYTTAIETAFLPTVSIHYGKSSSHVRTSDVLLGYGR